MADYEQQDPLIIASGDGCFLTDIEGRRYIDGVSSLWVTLHGHRKPQIDKAIKEQIDLISHSTLLGLSNIPATCLAERLVSIAPDGLDKVFYSDNGSTAVEIAIKMAYQYWQQTKEHFPFNPRKKTRFLSLVNAYHGDTIGSVSVGGIDLFHEIFRPLLFDTLHIQSPYCYRCHLGLSPQSCNFFCLDEVEKLLEEYGTEVAGLVFEPTVQGAAGVLTYPKGYLSRLAKLAKKHDILLIADEVATGFGRTGSMFACEKEGLRPDFLCLAKGLSGGYLPLAATVTTSRVYSAFLGQYADKKTFFHGHTYTGNPLACSAALASLALFDEEGTLENLKPKIEMLEKGLNRFRDLSHVGDIRQAGFMVGIELVTDRATKNPYPWEDKIGIKVTSEARERGIIIRPLGNVIVLMPPLSIEEEDLNSLLDITYQSIREVTGP